MRRCAEEDLQHCEQLVAEARERVVRQQVLIEQAVTLDQLDAACRVLDKLEEALLLREVERLRVLDVLTKSHRRPW